MSTKSDQTIAPVNIDHYRTIVKDLMERQELKSALFMADKVVDLSDSNPSDVLLLAQCLYRLKEYHRAIHCIKEKKLHEKCLAARYLVAKCHFCSNEFKEAFEVISFGEPPNVSSTNGDTLTMDGGDDVFLSIEDMKWKSSLYLLKGQIYEALDNRSIASINFKKSLKYDIYNYEAFESLTNHQMLTRMEEEELLKHLNPEDTMIKYLYENLLKKYSKPNNISDINNVSKCNNNSSCRTTKSTPKSESNQLYQELFHTNTDMMTSKAESLYYNCDYQSCYNVTRDVLAKDIYHTTCLPVHISCLMELKKTIELFELAHGLVNKYPESAISWYAVGCYYLMIQKTESARRFLNKSTTLDPVFGPAWLLYGHSFAVESEHDQAMAAYFKASHLMKGCHLPLLYIGLEYGLTDNTKLAEKFFNQALLIAPNDPFVLHELSVIYFQNHDYVKAETYSLKALNIIKSTKNTLVHVPEKWEALLNNMGHIKRKLKKFEESLDYHRQAMVLSPQNSSTFSAMGFVFMLQFNWTQAVEYFHKALGLKRDDPFTTSCLTQALDQLANQVSKDPLPDDELVKKFLEKRNKRNAGMIASSSSLAPSSIVSDSSTIQTCTAVKEETIGDDTMDDVEMQLLESDH